jgi:GT2 family glycosyltransferase/spore maturation protein CgeB
MGLHLGEVLPPRHDNPYGFFESIHMNNENRYLLRSMDRDWTCPPSQISDSVVEKRRLEMAIERTLQGHDGAWGFKDPRTLFTLGAWVSVLPEVRLVGVYRSTDSISRSLQRRDGFTSSEADAIAMRYNSRLADLHAQVQFPIVGFDIPGLDLVDRVQDVARFVGIDADKDVRSLVDAGIIHHQAPPQNSTDEYLASASSAPLDQDFMFARDELVGALRNLPERPENTDRRIGPAFRTRRHSAVQEALGSQPSVGLFLDLSPSTSTPSVPDGVAPDLFQWAPLLEGGEVPGIADRQGFTHVVGVDALDEVHPGSLEELLSGLARITSPTAVVVLSGTVLDSEHPPTSFFDERRRLSFQEGNSPFLHNRIDLERALSRTPWTIISVAAGRDFRMTLSKMAGPRTIAPAAMSGQRLRVEHEEILNRLKETEELRDAELETAGQNLRDLGVRADTLTSANEHLRSQLDDALGRIVESHQRIAESDERLAELSSQNEKLRSQVAERMAQVTVLKARVKKLASELAATKEKYARLSNRRSVRLALGLAQRLRFLRLVPGASAVYRRSKVQKAAAPPAKIDSRRVGKQEIVAAINRLRPPEPPKDQGQVSIIVPTRDGKHHMERLVQGLRSRTDYPNFELIVVDNASSDGTVEWLSGVTDLSVTVIQNSLNESFSRACNQGAEAATGSFLLFLNNDVDPINPGWLSAMVATANENGDTGAVGALLVYPEFSDPDGQKFQLTVQHRGIAYTWYKGRPRAVNLGRGEDPTVEVLARTFEVPSVTAACMLIPRDVFHEVGEFDEAYVYGTEDVDLNLMIRQSGRTVYFCGQAALFHHESASQDELGTGVVRVNRMTNAQVFVDRWAPSLSRTLRLDAISEETRWADPLRHGRTVAITLTRDDPSLGWGDWYTAHELGDAFIHAGWRVVYAERHEDRWYDLPDDVSLVISLLDSFDVSRLSSSAVTVAWIRNWTDRWLDRPWIGAYDILVPSSSVSADMIEERLGRASSVIPLASNPDRFFPGSKNPTYASDYVFTGNFWGQGREVIDQIIVDADERFLIFGKNWHKVPRVQRFWRGFLDYGSLPDVYRSATITIDDTAGPTLPYGAINSRVFDALASGSLVLTDNILGSAEIFGGLLPTYSSREELRALLDKYLQDEVARVELVDQLRAMVLESHTYDKRVDDFLAAVDAEFRAPCVAIKIGAPTWDAAEAWGDTHFARHFAAALRRQGFRTEIHVLSEWDDQGHQDADIVVHLRGLTPYVPKPSQINVLWIISHPEDISPREVERYDLVLVASSKYVAHLAEQVDVPVHVFHQATDASHFYPHPQQADLETDVLFVGNSRNSTRPAVDYLIELGVDFHLYGNDWDGRVPPGLQRGFMPNEQLPVLYSSCNILVNDHWSDMREWGFLSNRLFDALASGAFVVSDRVEGLAEAFGDAVPTFDSADSLGALIAKFHSDPDGRAALVAQGMSIVRDLHTFDARAKVFAELIAPFLADHRLEVAPS